MRGDSVTKRGGAVRTGLLWWQYNYNEWAYKHYDVFYEPSIRRHPDARIIKRMKYRGRAIRCVLGVHWQETNHRVRAIRWVGVVHSLWLVGSYDYSTIYGKRTAPAHRFTIPRWFILLIILVSRCRRRLSRWGFGLHKTHSVVYMFSLRAWPLD